jgi:DNA-binding MarR family transcriptional regulator
VTYAVLTDAGLAKVEDCRSTHLADIEELFASRFDAEEREQLAELLGRLPLADAGACNG